MARRSNGEGSIYYRERQNLWCGSISLGSTRRVVYGKTRKEVAQKLASLQQSVRLGNLVRPTKLTVAEYLDHWIKAQETRLRPKTLRGYNQLIKLALPMLGSLRLSNVRPPHILALLAARGTKTPRQTKLLYAVLRTAFNHAVRWQLLSASPMANIAAPKVPRKERIIWTQEEIQRWLACVQEYSHQRDTMLVLLLASGCRVGELLAVQYSDIYWDRSRIKIARSISNLGGHASEPGEPKTAAGRREIAIPAWGMRALEIQRSRHPDAANDSRVFVTATGSVPLNVWRDLQESCKRANVRPISVHALRHLHISLCARLGMDLATVSKRAGHSSVQITAAIYTHALGDDQHVAEALENISGGE